MYTPASVYERLITLKNPEPAGPFIRTLRKTSSTHPFHVWREAGCGVGIDMGKRTQQIAHRGSLSAGRPCILKLYCCAYQLPTSRPGYRSCRSMQDEVSKFEF